MKSLNETIREKLDLLRPEVITENTSFKRGDMVRITVTTRDPNYRAGDRLTILDPNYDKLGRDILMLATGKNGDIAVTADMIE